MPTSSTNDKYIDQYTYRITWSADDNEFVGLCTEFGSLSWLAPNSVEALQGIQQLVREIVQDMRKNGEPIPEPISLMRFSGKFVVRIPPALHRRLTMQAAEVGISLNRFVNAKLAG